MALPQIIHTGHDPAEDLPICVGQIFLPRTDLSAQEHARTIVETEVVRSGLYVYGWRQVPIDTGVIGEKADQTRPEIAQIMDLSVEAVESLTARGKRALAKLLAGRKEELGYRDDA